MFNISLILMVQIQYDSYEMAGRVAAVGILVWAAQTVPTARLVDRLGQRAIMWPLLVLHVAGVALAIHTAMTVGPEYLLWIAAGIASLSGPLGALTRARWSHILDSDEDIHTAFALEGSLDEVLFIGGPAVATVLATAVWAPMGLIVSTIGTAIGLTILLSQRSTEPPTRKEAGGESLGWRIPPAVIAVAFIAAGLGLLFGAFDISVVAFADEHHQKTWAGVILGVLSLGSFMGGLYYGSKHWKTPLWKRTIIGTCALAVGFTAISFAPNLLAFAVIGFFAGATIAPTITNADTVVQRVVKRGQITEGMAWLRIGVGVGVAGGAWAAGILIESSGARAGLFVAAAAGFLTFGIALLTAHLLKQNTERPGAETQDDAPAPAAKGEDFIDQPHMPPNV
jgi:MFS family permease